MGEQAHTAPGPSDPSMQESDLMRRALDSLPERIFWKDTHSRYLGCNHPFALDVGLRNATEVVGLSDYDLCWPGHATAVQNEDDRILCGDSAEITAERELHLSDGRTIWVRSSKYPLRGVPGQIVGLIGRYQDITQERAAKAGALLAIGSDRGGLWDWDLARKAVTPSPSWWHLLGASETAANTAYTAYFERVHAYARTRVGATIEIRTPLNDVISMLDLLKSTALDDEQRRFAATAHNNARSALKILNDVLDFSRMEAGKLSIDAVDFDLPALAKDVARAVAPQADAKKIGLLCVVGADVPRRVIGDPGRVRQILSKLLGNALKFTSNGHVVLTLAVEAQQDARCQLRVSVTDSGIGIAEHVQARLFRSFTQADKAIACVYGGTGRGLAICRQRVELMGGTLGLHSTPGHGSEVWVRLPVTVKETAMHVPSLADLRGAHVLVVDGNQTHREVLLAYLRVWGVRCEAVADGGAALDYLRFAAAATEPAQIVIIDMELADGDGITLGRALRSALREQPPALVLMNSGARHGDAAAARTAGFAAYLSKPAQADDVHAALVQALGLHVHHPIPPAEAPAATLITRHTLRESRADGRHLLVVEDDPVHQEVARGMLACLGYGVDIAVNGHAALTALANHDYALVLMGCQMPGLDGYAITRAIRAGAGGVRDANVPIVALIAPALPAERVHCLAAGMSDYLTKPIDSGRLQATLARWHERPPASAIPAQRFDHQALLQRLGADRELLVRVMRRFVVDTPARIAALAAAVARGDVDEVRQHAQQLQGVAGNVCAAALLTHATALEVAVRAGDLGAAPAACAALAGEFAAIYQALLALGISVPPAPTGISHSR